MSIDSSITAETMVELQASANLAARGLRDPIAMKRACERMDRRREDLRKRVGTINVAVDLVRSIRQD